MDAPTLPPEDPPSWRSVSPTLIAIRRWLGIAAWAPVVLVAVTAVAVLGPWWLAVALALVGLAAAAPGWVMIGRACRSWGYAERHDDLLVRHGIWVRRLSVVPYGRMQFVDVTAGPIDRRYGLSTVHLHTAAAATNAVIPGLPDAEAERLRDRLAALGEARSAGL